MGAFGQGEAYLDRLMEAMRLAPRGPNFESSITAVVIPLVDRVTGVADRLAVAQAAAEAVLSSPHVVPLHAMSARAGLALMAAERDDVAAAREQYDALEPQRGTMVSWVMVCADRLLGLLAQTMGNLDDAAAHLEDALAFCRRAGYRPELAWSCLDFGNVLLRRNASGDREKVASLLDEAQAISTELEMHPLVERAVALKEKAESAPGKAAQYPCGLTEREVEVLRLVASGRSSAEIAVELVLRIRTVERHISNIYGKIGAHGRADATAFAFTQGLISSR